MPGAVSRLRRSPPAGRTRSAIPVRPHHRRYLRRSVQSRDRRGRRVDRRLHPGPRAGAQGHRERQARGHREQGADRRARQRDLRQGPREGRDRRLRGRCRRRHPGDQGDPRGAVGQPHQLAGRDHQRYRQLHPQRNAREGPYLPRRARRGPGPGLCRGRPDLRRGRHRRRPQADHPCLDRLRHSAAVRQGLHRRHLEADQRRRQLRRRPRLSHQAPGRGASHRAASSCACTRP